MLASVSPVITGADAASPQPTLPSLASIRTSMFSAARISSPAMMTGFFIGRRTAIGSIDLIIAVRARPLKLLDAGLIDDVLEHIDFLHHPTPCGVGAFRAHLEAGLI